MKTKNKIVIIISLVIIVVVGLIAILTRNKKTTSTPTETKTTVNSNKSIELESKNKPYISLIPRTDGHELKLKIENIPSSVNQIEYELIYTAKDKESNLEMEKGVGDTIKEINKTIERDLLLGTSSCTNGCKYAYDEGVIGGTLSLTFITKDGQASYETPFILTTSTDIKNNSLNIPTENFSIKATTTTKSDYFVLIKNYGTPKSEAVSSIYSVFSNGTGTGKVVSITPETITKANTSSIVGDYLAK
jgi:hypothetical protein